MTGIVRSQSPSMRTREAHNPETKKGPTPLQNSPISLLVHTSTAHCRILVHASFVLLVEGQDKEGKCSTIYLLCSIPLWIYITPNTRETEGTHVRMRSSGSNTTISLSFLLCITLGAVSRPCSSDESGSARTICAKGRPGAFLFQDKLK